MADAAISFAVQKLGDFAIQKVDSLRVDRKVEQLKGDLERMQCFLKDAVEKQANDERIRKWISDIREVAHDSEDVIDILKVRSSGLLQRYRVADKIERIQAQLEAIDQSRKRYGIQDLGNEKVMSTAAKQVKWKRQLSPWEKDEHVVGIDEDVGSLLRKAIFDQTEGLSVASIVGMAGVGKSTLAKKVYNHPDVVNRFKRRGWVMISSDFSAKEIVMELAEQLLKESEKKKIREMMEKSPATMLQQVLHRHLVGKRYLVVMDDVWENADWESLRSAFPREGKSSRVLITSRRQDIPHCARYVHKLKTLDYDKSLELFLKKAFVENTSKFPEELESIGREILEKCGGLPLAITGVAEMLAKHRQLKNEWETVLKGMNSHFRTKESSASAILELSYHNLQPHLKSCFMCLGFFKDNATICTSKLIQVWIAQGLVPCRGEENGTMEDVARSYLDELIKLNMVLVKDTTMDGCVKSIDIHNLLREVSIRKAKEEISFEILRDEGASQSLDKPRHRAVYTERLVCFPANTNKRIRSLFFHGAADDKKINVNIDPSYWKSFELLRILDFEGFGLETLPPTIGELIGLRYLGLRNNKLKSLPSSLCRLINLQVLDIANNDYVKVPNVIWKIDSLRHLYMSCITCKGPFKIYTLKNLQTLTYIPLAHRTSKHLTKMTSLRKLGIENLNEKSDISMLCTSLAMLDNLVCLNLRWNGSIDIQSIDNGLNILLHVTQLKLQGQLMSLPSVNRFPTNLSYLTLVSSQLHEDPMPVLEKLPKLLHLKLNAAYNGEEMVISREGFRKLKVLVIRRLCSLRSIRVANGALPELKRLEADGCINLDRLPKALIQMTYNQELKIVTNPEISVPKKNFCKLLGKFLLQ